jgi:hypothetical protein
VGKKIRLYWYLYGKEKFFIGLTIGPTKIGSCLGTALLAEVAAQALSTHRVVPALGTIDRASCRARAVLFRVVPHASHRAWPIWNSIATPIWLSDVRFIAPLSLFFTSIHPQLYLIEWKGPLPTMVASEPDGARAGESSARQRVGWCQLLSAAPVRNDDTCHLCCPAGSGGAASASC